MVNYYGKATPASGSGGGSTDAVWGAITGTLSDQTDLQNALDAKQNTLTAGSGITISNGTISATGVESVANQNTNVGAINPLKIWNGTEQEWNNGGGSVTWYNWEYTSGGELSFTAGTIPSGTYQSVTYGNSAFVAVGKNACAYSTDGETWISVTIPSGNYSDVTYGNGKFVTVGRNVCAYSVDGETWTVGTIPNGTYHDVTYGNGIFVAVGDNVCAYSTDGETWTSGTISSNYYYGVTYGNSLFVAVGSTLDNIGVCAYATGSTTLSVFTTSDTPTTADTIYSAPSTVSALTITSVGTGTITLSDTNTYDYNASGNQTTTSSIGETYPNWLCNIDGVGLKIGTTDVANLASYTAGTNIAINNGVISATDTTYSAFGGATSQAAGSAGLVPAPTTGDVDKYLKGDGTWATVSGGSGIQNTATGTDSLTILGTPATNDYCINIGANSTAVTNWYEGSLAIGINAYASNGSIAIGTYNDEGSYYAEAYNGSVAIGINAKAGRSTTSYGAIAIGEAHAEYNNAIAIGCSCGGTSTIAEAAGAIQIGNGRNNTPNSLFVGFYDTINQEAFGNYQLLDGTTGKIPNDRINGATGSFTSQDGKTVTVTNGVITSIV